ncbi:MAG: transposase [Planctomycetaceae bacterium]
MGGVRHSRDQWLSWVVEQRSSGLTILAFCESVGIRENSFYRWRARLLAEGESLEDSQAISNRRAVTGRQGSAFVPLTVVASERTEIDLPCGATVRLPSDAAAIRCVLNVLLDADRGRSFDSPRGGSNEGGPTC